MMMWPSKQWPWGFVMQPQPVQRFRLMKQPSGGFPVPESVPWRQLPPAVKESVLRLVEGPPKPSVSLAVMNASQISMIPPDLPERPQRPNA